MKFSLDVLKDKQVNKFDLNFRSSRMCTSRRQKCVAALKTSLDLLPFKIIIENIKSRVKGLTFVRH